MHQPFYNALLNPDEPIPAGLMVWNDSDPSVRFAVYRNNVMASLIDALSENFPVLQSQVGDGFFRAMAAEFIRCHPPSSPVLAYYGENLAAWITNFPPLADWPWLSDLSVLEFARISSLHADDKDASAERIPEVIDPHVSGLILDSSLRIVQSSYAIYQIWCSHQTDDPPGGIDPYQPESVLLFRQSYDVVILPVSTAQSQFVSALVAGDTLMQSLEAGQRYDTFFEPEKTLMQLHQYGLIVTLREDIC